MFSQINSINKQTVANKYDTYVIVNLGEDDVSSKAANNLKKKLSQRYKNNLPIDDNQISWEHVLIINKEEFLNSSLSVDLPNAKKTKIYIVAHHEVGSNQLCDDNSFPVMSCKELASALANFIKNEEALVNLVCCETAKGINAKDSFAAKLHWILAKLSNRDIHVVARVAEVKVDPDTLCKKTSRIDPIKEEESEKTFIHHQPGSKVIFMFDQGKQIRLDVYTYQWRLEAFQIITDSHQNTEVANKKTLLKTWLDEFNNWEDRKIYQTIKDGLNNPNSALKNHASFISKCWFSLFNKETTSYQNIQALVENGKEPLAFKGPTKVMTGNRLNFE